MDIILSKAKFNEIIEFNPIALLKYAMKYDSANIVQYLLKNYEFDAKCKVDFLTKAVAQDSTKMVQCLLASGGFDANQLLGIQAQAFMDGKIEIGKILTEKMSELMSASK